MLLVFPCLGKNTWKNLNSMSASVNKKAYKISALLFSNISAWLLTCAPVSVGLCWVLSSHLTSVFHSLLLSFPSFMCHLCKCECGSTIYVLFILIFPFPSLLLPLTTFGVNGFCQWPYPEVVACRIFNIVWGFWKAQWDTEWAPLSLVTLHLLKSSGAGLHLISFSYRFFFCVTPMEAVEIIFHDTGLSTRKLLPNDCFYFGFHIMKMGLECPIFFYIAAGQLNRPAAVLESQLWY